MSNSSVTVEDGDEVSVIDYMWLSETPADDVADETSIGVKVGEDHTMFMTVGQARRIAEALVAGIEDIPAKRRLRAASAAMAAARRAGAA